MPRFAANLTMMFNEVAFLDRFDAAAKAGFTGVEYVSPYEFPAADVAAKLKSNNLTQVLHNLPPGNWGAGERGIAVLPDRTAEFRESVAKAITYAKALGCKQLNCLAGIAPKGVDEKKLRETFVTNLRYAAPLFKAEGIKLLIEAINTIDIPGFYLNATEQAADIIKEVGSDNLFIQYDIYHMQIMEGDLARTIEKYFAQIPHFQLADNPGRHEPGTGEINYPFLYQHLDRLGYQGWIGAEYKPLKATTEGLGWFAPYKGAK